MSASMDGGVVIPHEGKKPEWLEDDARVWFRENEARYDATAARLTWNDVGEIAIHLHDADHWAAPVLIYNQKHGTNFKPWNSKLQGDGPPKDYAGGKVMLRNGQIKDGWGMSWSWAPNDQEYRFDPAFDIIGYDPTPSQPSLPPHESAGENDLAIRCDEILSWKKTGIYEGSALQTLADELERQDRVTHISPILSAEKVTIDQALEFTASSLATPDLQAENARLRGALEATEGVLRDFACHGATNGPCRRTPEQCSSQCGLEAGNALICVLEALSTKGEG